jgi:hypothetical protein
MSQDIETVLLKDSRMMLTDEIKYGVFKGAENATVAKFPAVSKGVNSHTYNVTIPSQNTVVDRRVMVNSTITLQLSGIPAVGKTLINYGLTDALASFPYHSLCSNMTATINNTNVSVNIDDLQPVFSRLHDKRELYSYNSTAPIMNDPYKFYSDAVNTNNNPLAGYGNGGLDNDIVPRGAHYVAVGSSLVGGLPSGALVVGDGVTVQTAYVQFTVEEPLLLSPFTWINSKANNQGLYGISTLNFQFNMVGQVSSRVWRSANPWAITANVVSYGEPSLIFNFLTPFSSDILPAKNIVPYMNFARYITPYKNGIAPNAPATITTNSVQFSTIPDSVIIYARKAKGLLTTADSDSFYPIKNISVTFDNRSGILSSANTQSLFLMSKDNGINSNWHEFNGYASVVDVAGAGRTVATCGAPLMLKMGGDIPLQNWYSAGSLGQFHFQIDVTVQNNDSSFANDIEIVIIAVESGVLVSERGQSQIFTGLLSREDVLKASEKEPQSYNSVQRLVGGGFLDSLKTIFSKLAPIAKATLGAIPHPASQMLSHGLSMAGYGKSKMAHRLA